MHARHDDRACRERVRRRRQSPYRGYVPYRISYTCELHKVRSIRRQRRVLASDDACARARARARVKRRICRITRN